MTRKFRKYVSYAIIVIFAILSLAGMAGIKVSVVGSAPLIDHRCVTEVEPLFIPRDVDVIYLAGRSGCGYVLEFAGVRQRDYRLTVIEGRNIWMYYHDGACMPFTRTWGGNYSFRTIGNRERCTVYVHNSVSNDDLPYALKIELIGYQPRRQRQD